MEMPFSAQIVLSEAPSYPLPANSWRAASRIPQLGLENYFFAEIVLLFCVESCKICIERCGRRREIPLACITGTGGDDNAFFGISEMFNLSESQKMAG